MSRRRRAVVLLGLALVLGGLAASDVAQREAAVRAQLGPVVEVVVARADLTAGRRKLDAARPRRLRRVPRRYAPVGAASVPETLIGQELATAVPRGAYLGAWQLASEPGGRRAAGAQGRARGRGGRARRARASSSPVRASTCSSPATATAARLRGQSSRSRTSRCSPPARRRPGARDDGAERVAATLRVSVDDAVYLAAAQSFAREVRLLPRAAGDRGRTGQVTVGPGLR